MSVERAPLARRSLVKAVTYRTCMVSLDFVGAYIFTGRLEVALGFMLVRSTYATLTYFLHERLWARIPWGTPGAR
jgi:uncharacterized membrane protein